MRKRKSVIFAVLFSLIILVSMSSVVFAQEENWVEVTRFSGTRAFFGDTNSFTINHSEWRLRWTFDEGHLRAFLFDVKINETGQTIGSYNNGGKLNVTEGIYNITDNSGEFYLFIGTTGGYYSIIVEQNLAALPEFSSWLIASIFLVAPLAVIILKKKLTN